jgi:preprotein translocase subunit SecY
MYMWNEILSGRWYVTLVVVVLAVVMFGLIVFVDTAERRLTVQYAKRQVGRRMYGGQNTHLPIKVAMTGVMPIIFAYAIVNLPATIAVFVPNSGFATFIKNYFGQTSLAYMIITFALIIAFNYFYISIQYNTVEIANNIKNNGGTIPGIRPGKPTKDFIQKILNRVTFIGAIFLAVIAVLPMIVYAILAIEPVYNAVGSFLKVNLVGVLGGIAFSGSSILIVVGVALETIRELEAQLTMRNYKGFLD